MKNQLIKILSIVIISALIVLFALNRINQNKANTNPFLNSDIAKNINDAGTKLIKINGVNYRFEDLPESIRKELLKEEIIYESKKLAILKSFAIRAYKLSEVNDGKIPPEIPPLVKFVDIKVSPEEIQKNYQNQKNSFPANASFESIKNQISFNIISDRVIEFYNSILRSLYNNKQLVITNLYPLIPENWLDSKLLPTIGNQDAKNQLFIVSNYFCRDCIKVNNEAIFYFKNHPQNLSLTLIPLPAEGIIGNTLFSYSQCLYEANPKNYWLYQEEIFNSITKLGIQDDVRYLNQVNTLLDQLIKKYDFSMEKTKECAKNAIKINAQYISITSQLSFIDIGQVPFVIYNQKKIDLEQLTLEEGINLNSIH